jgi:two-component system OmpR family response regulator
MENTDHVLIVDDDRGIRELLATYLEKNGLRVSLAANGRQMRTVLEQGAPDLIVLDLMLPGEDGLVLCRELRAGKFRAVPVLMLTARSEEADRIFGLNAGVDDYLTKPFSTGELIARVMALLRRMELIRQILATDQNKTAHVPLVRGPLRLDTESRLAYLSEESLDLSPAEFDLLHLFLRNPGRAFSRSYLLDTIWGEGYVAGDRSIDNMILRLRKKLGSLGNEIETVWGIGYRLRAEQK